MLQYVSPLLFKILEIYKLYEIPYEQLHKWCKFYYTPMITYEEFKIQKCGQILCAHFTCRATL